MKHSGTNPWIVALVVSIATFMEVLDTTITNVSLRHIAGSLGAGQEESTWVLTSYLVANAIILPLSGWLSDVMGRRRFFITCIIGFTAASFACGAATSLTALIIFRVLQGAAGGGLQPTQQAIIIDAFPPAKRGAVFAITGVTMIAAPVLGPTLGGIITDHFSWRWIFYINVPVGIIAAFLVWKFVENDPPHTKSPIDYIGVSLVALGIAALQIVLDKGQQEDWFGSPFIITWSLVCFVCIAVAIMWLWGKDSVIDLSLFQDRGFSAGCCLIFLTGFVLYGGSTLLPLMLQSQFGYTATLAGLILSPAALVIIFLMPVSGKLISRVQVRYMIFLGVALTAFGMYNTALLTPQTDFDTFLWMRVTQVLGLPFLFIPISTMAFMNVPKHKSNKASAMFSLFRNIGGSVGIAVVGTYQIQHAQIQRHHLAENLVPGSLNYEHYRQTVESNIGNHQLASAYMDRSLEVQASIAAYADAYMFLAVLLLVAFCIIPFVLPANKPAGSSPAEAH